MATSLEMLKNSDLSSTPKMLSYGKKVQKSHVVCVLLTTQNWLPWQHPLRNRKKTGPDQENSRKYLPFGEKVVKICPVDTVKEEEINASNIYSPSGKFAERAKL